LVCFPYVFFFYFIYDLILFLHSFPTRRSSDLLSPYSPKLTRLPLHDRPSLRPLCILRYLVRLGCSMISPSPRDHGAVRAGARRADRKSTRLNSSHVKTSYAVICLKKKIKFRQI